MKLLLVSGAIPHPSARSGSALVLNGQLASLVGRHDITLITFAPADADEERALGRWRTAGVTVLAAGEGIPRELVSMKRRFERGLNAVLGRHPNQHLVRANPRTQLAIDRALARAQFDLVQVDNIGVGSYTIPGSLPRIMVEHEVGRSVTGDPDDWRHLQPALWRAFDRIQVFTREDASRAAAIAPDLASRFRVNPFGIDLPQARDPRFEESATLLFVGGFDHPPNVDAARWLALEILPMIARRCPSVRLLLVGHAPPSAVQQLESDRVEVTGGVTSVEGYFARASVVMAPVRLGGGMRRKVLEAMAHGKSVVTTRLGTEGLAGAPADHPVVVADTVDAIAEGTVKLLVEPHTRRQLGARARSFVAQHHSWMAYGDRLDELYDEVRRR